MGGSAFAHAKAPGEPMLHTPRMTAAEYSHLKTIYLDRLNKIFPGCSVKALIEAPEKVTFGDIDLIIGLDQQVDLLKLANQIGAAGFILRSAHKCSLAVLRDGSMSDRQAVVYKQIAAPLPTAEAPSAPVTGEEYSQIDLELIPTEQYEWYSFYSSYGDFASILGKIVRFLGFTFNNCGLFLRMKELEECKSIPHMQIANDDGFILLSSTPALVMEFLGLSKEKYDAGFSTVEQMFEWVSSCRLLAADVVKLKKGTADEVHREMKRTMYTTYFDEWLPLRLASDSPASIDMDSSDGDHGKGARSADVEAKREYWLNQAVDFFGKRAKYDHRRQSIALQVKHATAAHLLKPLVSHHSGRRDKHLTEIMRAFRRWVGCQDGQLYVLQEPQDDVESQLHHLLNEDRTALTDPGAVDEWICQHWERVRSLERERKGTRQK